MFANQTLENLCRVVLAALCAKCKADVQPFVFDVTVDLEGPRERSCEISEEVVVRRLNPGGNKMNRDA